MTAPRTQRSYFNPRSPWGERRRPLKALRKRFIFQSTLPVGGATCPDLLESKDLGNFNPRSPWGERPKGRQDRIGGGNFNPRSPWGERPLRPACACSTNGISIHAPRGGSDLEYIPLYKFPAAFQSTLPVGGATHSYQRKKHFFHYFNPRSPWGERQAVD